MTNKLVVIINSLKVRKIKKILLYEMKFLVPNYSCLQNTWLGGYCPQIPFLSVLNWICWTPPPNKIPGYATACCHISSHRKSWCYRTALFLIIMSNWYISLCFIAPLPYLNTFASNKALACCTPSSAIFYAVGLCCNTILKGNILQNYCRQMNELLTRRRLKVLVLF